MTQALLGGGEKRSFEIETSVRWVENIESGELYLCVPRAGVEDFEWGAAMGEVESLDCRLLDDPEVILQSLDEFPEIGDYQMIPVVPLEDVALEEA